MFQTIDLRGACAVCGAVEGTACEHSAEVDWEIGNVLKPAPVKRISKCLRCRRELSPYLDAYYGKNCMQKVFCRDCRIKEKP